MGSDEQLRAAAEPLDGPIDRAGRARLARELAVELIAGSIVERVPDREKLANTSVHVGPDGELKAVYRKIHMFDVEVAGRSYRESDLEEPGEEIVLSETAGGRRAGDVDLLRPALPRAVPDPRRARRARVPAAGGLHAGDDARSLGGPAARSRDREPGVRGRGQPDRRAPRRQPLGRPLDDRRPVGRRAGAGARRRGSRDRRARPRAPARRSARSCRRWPTGARRPTAGRRRFAHERRELEWGRRDAELRGESGPDPHRRAGGRREAGAGQAPPDPRCGCAGVRAPGLPRLSRRRHRRRGRRRVRPRLPLLRLQGRGARHAVPRALGGDARADSRGRCRAAAGAGEARARSRRSSSTAIATTRT